jgi:16S rRNA (cytosine967-C5)-methyltransferase
MQISSLLGHTQELFRTIRASTGPADAAIDSYFRSRRYLGSHDRRFIAETTYGTLRHLRFCAWRLNSLLDKSVRTIPDHDEDLLLIVVYLVLHTAVKEITPSLVSEKIKNPRLRERLPAFFAAMQSPPASWPKSVSERLGLEYSFPDWMVGRFISDYGEGETENILKSLNVQAPLTLRVNLLKTTREQCQKELRKQGIDSTPTSLSPFGLRILKRINVFSLSIFRNGWFEVQDEGSQLLPVIVDPRPASKLLDACAGAGGKTLEFAALMKNRGEIYATDINSRRLGELRRRLKRSGAQNVRVLEIRSIDQLRARFAGFFDVVFIDAPCSGLGTIRRNPGMKWNVSEQTVGEVCEKQRSILSSCAPLVREGGTMVYATCTLLSEENEKQIESFLSEHPEFAPAGAGRTADALHAGSADFIKLLPHIHGTDGFFCAVLQKRTVC